VSVETELSYGGPAVHGGTVGDLADQAWQDYLGVVTRGMDKHPRSQQKMIGPSEIGDPCNRALICKLAQLPEPARGPAWKPQVGTACHAQMEEWFEDEEVVMAPRGDRYLVEQEVFCGMIGPEKLTGHTDLVDKWLGGVIDHKFVGKTRLLMYRTKGPGQLYRVQAHTYGKGWELEGYRVRFVMICFLPRDGELSDAFHWWEPYDPAVADWAIARCNQLDQMWRALGVQKALELFPLCQDNYCDWCALDRAKSAAANPFKIN
jgi:hypothetical protein